MQYPVFSDIRNKAAILIFLLCLILPFYNCDHADNSESELGVVVGDAEIPCKFVQLSLQDPVAVQCNFTSSQYPISLVELIDNLNQELAEFDVKIDGSSRIWAEALGGHGKKGKNATGHGGGGGGNSGYARMGTTLGNLINNILEDKENIYILVGEGGKKVSGDETGGTGGASTLIIGKELTDISDPLDPAGESVLVIGAGGGGGGGATIFNQGKGGGSGRDAVSTIISEASVKGGNGSDFSGGDGGNANGMGSGGDGIDDGNAGIGGVSGSKKGVRASWGIDIETAGYGNGGRGGNFRGGSGGGGFGGGGAGGACESGLACGAGGAAGGSWARKSIIENTIGPFPGKEGLKIGGEGVAALTFETVPVNSVTSPADDMFESADNCKIVQDSIFETAYVNCTYVTSEYPLSMIDLIAEINELIEPLKLIVDDESFLWIEARGGRGGRGPSDTSGGVGGYARTAFTVSELLGNILLDGNNVYLMVGSKAVEKGDGGASSIVIGKDLRGVLPSKLLDPEGELVIAIAAGGGGHGAGDVGKIAGKGGAAIATVSETASAAGGNGRGDRNGKGANKNGTGEAGSGHHSGGSGIGGKGGKGTVGDTGWLGIDIEWTGGGGGNSADKKGGGGGGGFGGGGAGAATDDIFRSENAGGGAGGSWARQSTADNSEGGFLGQGKLPENDENGVIVLTFETFPVQ